MEDEGKAIKIDGAYLKKFTERRKQSRAYHKHQAIGADLAEILNDARHTALYIKLALQFDEQRLRSVAKTIADNKNVKNKGAYFMSVLYGDKKPKP